MRMGSAASSQAAVVLTIAPAPPTAIATLDPVRLLGSMANCP